ncbi:MAG: pyridoxal-dependent decarboxylase [Pseudomonadota bacterium]
MTLDPQDWEDLNKEAKLTLDAAMEHWQSMSDGRVWTPFPDHLKSALGFGIPKKGMQISDIRGALVDLMPYGVGNTHPRFFGWVHGSGDPSGVLAEIVASAMNANCGGRDHVGLYVERQVVDWARELTGLPETASGLVVSGTSMATLIALKVARDKAWFFQARDHGNPERMVAYASANAHSCVAKTLDILGFGKEALRKAPMGADGKVDIATLKDLIYLDNEAGLKPFAIIGTAGDVNTGDIDDLEALSSVAKRNGLWFHVDGAFGVSAALLPEVKERLAGLELADSVAFDFHKWWHVNYDAGCVLIRNGEDHLRSWSDRPDYLAPGDALAGGAPWPTDMGPELSRGFRALKVWAHLLIHGTERIAEQMARNIAQVKTLAAMITEIEELELSFEPSMNICCFRLVYPETNLDALNAAVVAEVQRAGLAAPSTTRIDGNLVIRVNITNHRTQDEDLDVLLDAVMDAGAKLREKFATA